MTTHTVPALPPEGAMTLAEWTLDPHLTVEDHRQVRPLTFAMLVASGIEQAAYEVWEGTDVNEAPWALAMRLANYLLALEQRFPAMTVPVAVRWSIVMATGQPRPRLADDVAANVAAWPEVLLETGWLLMAAGVTAQEAAEALAAGTLPTHAEAAMLAALRGFALPGA